MTADELYKRGNEQRKQGLFNDAMNSYLEAIALDPESPAVVAKEMLEEQFAFYCKDYYNP